MSLDQTECEISSAVISPNNGTFSTITVQEDEGAESTEPQASMQ